LLALLTITEKRAFTTQKLALRMAPISSQTLTMTEQAARSAFPIWIALPEK
jgi:hypothetical protein